MKCWKNWKEERDTDLRVLDEDDWRLIRVLMIEVNMITYEWNRDDLKENENMKDEVDMNWLFVWRRVFEIVNWYWLNRCNDIESIEIEYENDDDLMRIVSFRITIWDSNDMIMIEYDDWIEWIWIEDEMIREWVEWQWDSIWR